MNLTNISQLYGNRLSLLTDLYELTMMDAYLKAGIHDRQSVFHLFYRSNPFGGAYAVACGLDLIIDYIENLRFTPKDVEYLRSLKGAPERPLFSDEFLDLLLNMQFECDLDAVPEGTIVFPNEPLVRVKGPLWQAQFFETVLLNIVNFSTLICTKASRIAQAAKGDEVLEFGLRRAQGIDGGITEARAAYIGGCHATSNVLAGKLFGIPVKGTHAHSWVMSFETEEKAFQAYAAAMPHNSIFLVDTFDTIEGVKKAIAVGEMLRRKGHRLNGIRLDSGNLTELSIAARKMLDAAGFQEAIIVASGSLDEYRIQSLKSEGAKIDAWGVGTRLATAHDDPALDGVYKLGAIQRENDWAYELKLSDTEAKISNPGIQQVRRIMKDHRPVADIIYDEKLTDPENFKYQNGRNEVVNVAFSEGKNLLEPIFRSGKLVYTAPRIEMMREKVKTEIESYRTVDFSNYPVALECTLLHKKEELIKNFTK